MTDDGLPQRAHAQLLVEQTDALRLHSVGWKLLPRITAATPECEGLSRRWLPH